MALKTMTPEDILINKIESLQKQMTIAINEYYAVKAAESPDDGGKPFVPRFVWDEEKDKTPKNNKSRKPKGRK